MQRMCSRIFLEEIVLELSKDLPKKLVLAVAVLFS